RLQEQATAEYRDVAARLLLDALDLGGDVAGEHGCRLPPGILQGAGRNVLPGPVQMGGHRIGVRLVRPERSHLLERLAAEEKCVRSRHALSSRLPLGLVEVRRGPPAVLETTL